MVRAHRRSYQSLTLKRKLEIINAVQKSPASKKKKEIAAEFDVPQSTLRTIVKNKESLKGSYAFGSNIRNVTVTLSRLM